MKPLLKPQAVQNIILSVALVFFLLFSPLIKSQSFVWATSQEIQYDFNPEFLNYSTAVNSSGFVYYGGLKNYASHYNNNAFGDNFFIKYDRFGAQMFYKVFSGECIITNMTCDADNNVLITGMLTNNTTFAPGQTMSFTGSGTNAFLVKLNEHGNFIWMKNLTEIYGFANKIDGLSIDQENNVYIVYTNNSNASSIIRKFSSTGEEMLEIVQTSVSIISSIDISNSGEIFVCGSCPGSNSVFGGVPFNPGFSYSTYVAKYDASGTTQWVKFVEDITCTNPRIRWSPAGDIYFSGKLSAGFTFGTIPTNGPTWVYDFFLAKISGDGEFLWVREVPETLSGDATIGKLNHLSLDSYGNPYISGFTRGEIDWDNNWQTSVSARGPITLAYNANGDFRWIKTGDGAFDTQAMAVFSPDEIYIAGTAFGQLLLDDLTVTSNSFYFPFLAKMEAVTTGNVESTFTNSTVGIYPNPMVYNTSFCVEGTEALIQDIEIIDLSGKLIKSFENIYQTRLRLEREQINEGIYFVKFKLSNGMILSKKLVIID